MLAQLKKHLTLHELWEDAKFFFLLNLGLVATAVGIAVFKTPNHFAFGGTSGLSIVLATLFPRWNVGAFMWFINAALVVLGFVFLGIRSMGWTIYSSFALSFYVSLCERVCPLSAPLTSDAFLELCFAVILSAVGAAVVFNIGASTGGTDIVAMILNKYTSMPVGRALMVSDLGIVLVGAYLYGPATGLYCILGMILKSTVADSAIESINLRKVCTVVTSNPQPVRDFIVNDLHRSAAMPRPYPDQTPRSHRGCSVQNPARRESTFPAPLCRGRVCPALHSASFPVSGQPPYCCGPDMSGPYGSATVPPLTITIFPLVRANAAVSQVVTIV